MRMIEYHFILQLCIYILIDSVQYYILIGFILFILTPNRLQYNKENTILFY